MHAIEKITFDPYAQPSTENNKKKSNEAKRKGDKGDSQRPRVHYEGTALDEESDEHVL